MAHKKGFRFPAALITPASVIVDVGGVLYLWNPVTRELLNVEALADRVDEIYP